MRRSTKTVAVLLASLLLASGCAVVARPARLLADGPAGFAFKPYEGTQIDIEALRIDPPAILSLIFLIDLPISLAVDTAFLPVDGLGAAIRAPHGEPRRDGGEPLRDKEPREPARDVVEREPARDRS
jgi:uncharacterized protein YceK